MLKPKRLSLSKETLKNLTPHQGAPVLGTPEMRRVVGGDSFIICTASCPDETTCDPGPCHTRQVSCAPCDTHLTDCIQCNVTSNLPNCPVGGGCGPNKRMPI